MNSLYHYIKRNWWKFTLVVVGLNLLLFGRDYLTHPNTAVIGTLVTFIVSALSFQWFRWVAGIVQSRLPGGRNLFPRLILTIVLVILMTGVILTILFYGYDYLPVSDYQLDENVYNWTMAGAVILIIFGAIAQEGRTSFIKWKTTLTETEQLKKEHMHSQLLGLRSQVSPHFLFNSLNSLSSLIADDPKRAEYFLNEMSKVYRYLLRNNEEQVVELETELNFLNSYFYLLKTRYGNGVQLCLSVDEDYDKRLLPPLTLQTILDSIFRENLISKQRPLTINIRINEDGWLEISHNIQKRISETLMSDDLAMVNISNKFRLLCQLNIEIAERNGYRYLNVPLISSEQMVFS